MSLVQSYNWSPESLYGQVSGGACVSATETHRESPSRTVTRQRTATCLPPLPPSPPIPRYTDLLGCIDRMTVEELVMAVRWGTWGSRHGGGGVNVAGAATQALAAPAHKKGREAGHENMEQQWGHAGNAGHAASRRT